MNARPPFAPEALEPRQLLAATYQINLLSTDKFNPSAAYFDTHLVNPRGMVADQFGIRVADAGTSNSTDYNGHGRTGGPVGHLPGTNGAANGSPTGIVRNLTGLFPMTANGITMFSKYIIVSEDGGVIGYNDLVTPNGIMQVDNSSKGAVYEGDALAFNGSDPYVYAVDSHNERVDIFDTNFQQVQFAGNFTDSQLPAGYVPFDIAANNGNLYIAYAKAKTGIKDETAGAGTGVIDEFNTDGTFVKRVTTGGSLNEPWGMAWAPHNFGWVNAGDMLVANHGDGKVNVYGPTGNFRGQLKDKNGKVISVDGLWGVTFGNDLNGARSDRLYFTAGTHQGHDGLYASLQVVGSAQPKALSNAAASIFSEEKIGDSLKDVLD